MRQRNTSGYVLDVWAYPDQEHPDRRPFTVGPQEVVDYPDLLAGFTEEPEEADTAAAAKPARKSAAKSAEGGESA